MNGLDDRELWLLCLSATLLQLKTYCSETVFRCFCVSIASSTFSLCTILGSFNKQIMAQISDASKAQAAGGAWGGVSNRCATG